MQDGEYNSANMISDYDTLEFPRSPKLNMREIAANLQNQVPMQKIAQKQQSLRKCYTNQKQAYTLTPKRSGATTNRKKNHVLRNS